MVGPRGRALTDRVGRRQQTVQHDEHYPLLVARRMSNDHHETVDVELSLMS